jgi:hypothetical protein
MCCSVLGAGLTLDETVVKFAGQSVMGWSFRFGSASKRGMVPFLSSACSSSLLVVSFGSFSLLFVVNSIRIKRRFLRSVVDDGGLKRTVSVRLVSGGRLPSAGKCGGGGVCNAS